MLGLTGIQVFFPQTQSQETSSAARPGCVQMVLHCMKHVCVCVFTELQQFHGVRRFELDRSCCFSSLLLDEERGRLFVGARNFLLSLSLDNIAKQEHKVSQSTARVDQRTAESVC